MVGVTEPSNGNWPLYLQVLTSALLAQHKWQAEILANTNAHTVSSGSNISSCFPPASPAEFEVRAKEFGFCEVSVVVEKNWCRLGDSNT